MSLANPFDDLLAHETWLARKLGVRITALGLTTPEQRREMVRNLCKPRAAEVVGRNKHTGKTETYAELFHRMYREPLDQPDLFGSTGT